MATFKANDPLDAAFASPRRLYFPAGYFHHPAYSVCAYPVFLAFATNGTAFDIVSNTRNQGGKPAAFGTKSLDPFFAPGASGFIANFTNPISSARLDFGDYGQDTNTLTLNAYSGADGTGTLLATQTVNYDTAAFPNFATASVMGTSILSLTWSGTSSSAGFNNSVFYDNLNVVTPAATPELGFIAFVISFALIGAAFLRRHKQAGKVA